MTPRLVLAVLVLVPFVVLGLPLQLLLLKTTRHAWAVLPQLFFRLLAFGLDLRIIVHGKPAPAPALLIANHISWLDIIVLGATLPMRFVSKTDVERDPLLGFFARLQKSFFVDRRRRVDTARSSRLMADAFTKDHRVLLFGEGTSGTGTHVMPFKSALIGAIGKAGTSPVPIQPVALAYTALCNLPLSHGERTKIAWIGDMGLGDNLAAILGSGPKSVSLAFGALLPPDADRKRLAREAETRVRHMLVMLNRAQPLPSDGLLL